MLRGLAAAEFAGACFAWANLAQMVEAEDTGGVAVCEFDLNCVISYCCGRARRDPGLKDGKSGGIRGRFGTELAVLVAFFAASSAGAVLAQVRKIVMAGVRVGPGNVHAFPAGDADFHVHRFLADVERDRHRFISRGPGVSNDYFRTSCHSAQARTARTNRAQTHCEFTWDGRVPQNYSGSGRYFPRRSRGQEEKTSTCESRP